MNVREARDRNWKIFRLRGLYQQAMLLTGERQAAAQKAIDEELEQLNAETESGRRVRQREEIFNAKSR